MTEAVVNSYHNTVVVGPQSPEVIVTTTQQSVVLGLPDQQNTVVTGLLGPTGPRGRDASILKTYNFTESLQWQVNHNMDTKVFVVALFDQNGEQFFAKVEALNTNTIVVYLTEAISGSVNVLFKQAVP